MIIVEVKQEQERLFPKLMKNSNNDVIEVHFHPEEEGKFLGIWRTGLYIGEISLNINISGCKDFNGEITIKNL